MTPNLSKYAAGTTGGCSVTLTPDSDKCVYLHSIWGFNDQANIIEIRNALTGTVSTTNTSAAVVGVGTKFLSELSPGDTIRVATSLEVLEVSSIADDTHLTTVAASGSTQATKAIVRLIAEIGTPTEVNHPISHFINKGLWGSRGKALTCQIIDSLADCSLTVTGYNG